MELMDNKAGKACLIHVLTRLRGLVRVLFYEHHCYYNTTRTYHSQDVTDTKQNATVFLDRLC